MFDAEKRKFGEAMALDRDAKRAKLHADNQAAEAAKNAPPEDYKEYFSAGDPMWRGERRIVPQGVTTPSQMVEHMFPGGKGEIGKSWTLNKFVANHFQRQESMPSHFVNNISDMGNLAKVTFHANANPTDVSYDDGQIPDATTGKMVNWGPGWKHRVGRLAPRGSALRRGDMGEAELLMRNDTEIPIHGMTMHFGSSMNFHQFEQPLIAITKYRHQGN